MTAAGWTRTGRRRLICAVVLALLGLVRPVPSSASSSPRPLTIPALQQWAAHPGGFRLGPHAVLVADTPALEPVAAVLGEDLRALTGRRLPVRVGGGAHAGDVQLLLGEQDPRVGREGYRLTSGAVLTIRAAAPAGAFYGTRTLLQLLRQNPVVPGGVALDWPRYPERGLMVDTGDKSFSYGWLTSHIKDLAYIKANQLHLHFSDNNGFRIESTRHPEIVSADHLTKKQVRDLVALAGRYFITVVPEIDMPGHMGAALAPHPEWTLKNVAGAQTLPYAGDLDITNPAARRFARDLVAEYLPLFPGRYWHLGGDEYMPDQELALFPQLTAYAQAKHGPNATAGDALIDFYDEMNRFLRAHHKTMRMWHDEMNVGSVVKVDTDVVAEWWTDRNPIGNMSTPTPQELLDAGHRVMNCGWFPTYYDTGSSGQYVLPRADMGRAYEQWEPYQFYGAFFSPAVASQSVTLPPQTIAPAEPRDLGSNINVWTSDNEPEATTTAGLYPWLRVIAQKTWGSPRLTATYADFQPVIAAVGRAPGWTLG